MSFQRILTIITLVILIVILLVVFVFVNNYYTKRNYNFLVTTCPDYWVDLKGNGICTNVKNLGKCGVKDKNFNVEPYKGNHGRCAKYTWATGCNIAWEGITYGIKNPCI